MNETSYIIIHNLIYLFYFVFNRMASYVNNVYSNVCIMRICTNKIKVAKYSNSKLLPRKG